MRRPAIGGDVPLVATCELSWEAAVWCSALCWGERFDFVFPLPIAALGRVQRNDNSEERKGREQRRGQTRSFLSDKSQTVNYAMYYVASSELYRIGKVGEMVGDAMG